jgi:hypothetical protein
MEQAKPRKHHHEVAFYTNDPHNRVEFAVCACGETKMVYDLVNDTWLEFPWGNDGAVL